MKDVHYYSVDNKQGNMKSKVTFGHVEQHQVGPSWSKLYTVVFDRSCISS